MASKHKCACQHCLPITYNEFESNLHLFIFADDRRARLINDVIVDGQLANKADIVGVLRGDEGAVVFLTTPVHICPCGHESVCVYIRRGNVELRTSAFLPEERAINDSN